MKSTTIWEDVEPNLPTFEDYLKTAPGIQQIHYWDLPDHLTVDISDFKLRSPSLSVNNPTIKTIKRIAGKDIEIETKIKRIINWTMKRFDLNVKLPLDLVNEHYVSLYSLMLSEGHYKNAFRLQVPEKEFHQIFATSIEKLFPENDFSKLYSINNNDIPRSTGSSILRYFIPIPEIIPRFILDNKDFAETYLRIAFEAEGSVLSRGIIQLSRSIELPKDFKIDGKTGKRIFIGDIRKNYPILYSKLVKHLPMTLIGEYLMLKRHFGIEGKMIPESVRINKTTARRGKYSVKWKLRITSVNKNKFVKEIGFITEYKNNKAIKTLDIPTRKPKFFAFETMKEISKNGLFTRKEFVRRMGNIYKYPQSFIQNYERIGVIKRIVKGKYKIARPYQPKQHR